MALLAVCFVLGACQQHKELNLNHIQLIGTHNSYKQEMDPAIMQAVRDFDSTLANSLDYGHKSLAGQLDRGARTLEIDVYHDSYGGKYSSPIGIRDQIAAGLTPKPLDTAIMNRPGFKVLHIQDIDFRTSCATFRICLEQLVSWSKAHPGHQPIFISINPKSTGLPYRPDFTVPLPFTSEVFDALDEEIRSVMTEDRMLTPDEVRGVSASLEEAILTKGWPLLEECKNQFIFVLDANTKDRKTYKEGHPSLAGRAMFITAKPGTPEAAIVFKNDPVSGFEDIQRLVGQGYIVRTRSDANTTEARTNDLGRFEKAMQSGAQIISTDYLDANPKFNTGYRVGFPDGGYFRCNPLLVNKEAVQCAVSDQLAKSPTD